MLVVIGVWFALAGGLAALAGLTAMRRARRLRRGGCPVWAVALPRPVGVDEEAGGSPGGTVIQYTLADGRVVERLSPGSARKAAMLRPGQKVLVWYDPEDPQDVLVYGREGRAADLAFVVAGVLFIMLGVGIVALGH
ncbi:MAG TPA: DUF3592 domain-containing protein [Streptosporangiaceae bacterium]|nr:DUF3592 domain-containing protein [Streptosporangiaceae bacterium]